MNDNRTSSSSAGLIIAIILAVVAIPAVLVLVALGVAAYLFLSLEAPMVETPVVLPEVVSVEGSSARSVVVNLDAEGQIRFHDRPMDQAELEQALAKLATDSPEGINVKIVAHPDCEYQEVVSVMDACVGLNLTTIQMVSANEADDQDAAATDQEDKATDQEEKDSGQQDKASGPLNEGGPQVNEAGN